MRLAVVAWPRLSLASSLSSRQPVPEVKQFGQRIVRPTATKNRKLMALAKELEATPPEKPGEKAEATEARARAFSN